MFTKKFSRRVLAAALAFSAFTSFQISYAKIETFEGKGTCIQGDLMTEAESKNVAKVNAELDAQKAAGTYLVNFSHAENFSLFESEIFAVVNKIISTFDVKYSQATTIFNNSPVIQHIATLKAKIDTDGLKSYIEVNDKEKVDILQQYAHTQKVMAKQVEKIEDLNRQYNSTNSQQEKQIIRAEFVEANSQLQAAQKIAEGNAFLRKGNLNEAFKSYTTALSIDPSSAGAYYQRGYISMLKNNYNDAVADFNSAIKLDPNYSYAYFQRAQTFVKLKKYDNADKDYAMAVKISPDKVYFYKVWADNDYLYKKKRAIEILTDAVNNNPDNFDAYVNLADYYFAVFSNYKKAVEVYTDAINRSVFLYQRPSPEFDYTKSNAIYYAYEKRADIYEWYLKDYKRAVEDYTKMIELRPNPKNNTAYSRRAKIYNVNLKDFDRAIADYQKSIELYPWAHGDYKALAEIFVKRGEYKKAIEVYEKELQHISDVGKISIYRKMGDCYQKMGNNAKAQECYAESERLNKSSK